MDWQLKTLVGNRGSFVSTRGCEGGWNDGQNDDSPALSLCLCW